MIYLARRNDVIYVLDCFEKNSRKTERHDIKRATRDSNKSSRGFLRRKEMPNVNQLNRPGHITKGDILDDLGFSPAETLEAKIKAGLWRDLLDHIERRGLDQASLQRKLKIHQPDVSNLLRGKISKFSTGKLIQFAVKLDLDVRVELKEPKTAKRIVSSISAAKARKTGREMVRA
jgi:predicted XRE-type DNA-binding protein